MPWLVSFAGAFPTEPLRNRLYRVRPLDVEPAYGAVILGIAEATGGARIPKYITA